VIWDQERIRLKRCEWLGPLAEILSQSFAGFGRKVSDRPTGGEYPKGTESDLCANRAKQLRELAAARVAIMTHTLVLPWS
jgi:hypothetical protein